MKKLNPLFLFLFLFHSCGGNEDKPIAPASKQLEGRMLCAANLAYNAQNNGTLKSPEPWLSGAGFTEPPKVIVNGPGGIHLCIIGKNADGIVIAFRGTLPPETINMPVLADWINNILLLPPQETEGFKGKTHGGMNSAVVSLWPEINKSLEAMGANAQSKIYLTGHSKGGAMALVAATFLVKHKKIKPAAVVTFAAPRAGDAAFIEMLDSIPVVRYENSGDLIPLLPPDFAFLSIAEQIPHIGAVLAKAKDWEFESAGELRYIQEDGIISSGSMLIALKRAEDLINLLTQSDSGAGAIVKAHQCGCGSAYQKAAAPDVKCP